MEESREQQHPLTAVVVPSIYPQQQLSTYSAVPPARPGRWLTFRRTLRLMLVRILRGLIIGGRALRPYAAFLFVVIALLGVIGWMGIQLWWPKTTSTSVVDQRVAALAPAPAVETYMKGRQSYNADMMWDSFSTEYQADQLESGASKSTMQAQANRERMIGLKYERYEYIGGVKLEDGSGMYFYALQLSLQNQQAKLPIVFSADADGKIERIILPGQGQSQSQ